MEVLIKRGEYLPHWTKEGSIYHVCFRLKDSLARTVLDKWQMERDSIIQAPELQKRKYSDEELKRLRILFSDKIDKYLDAGNGKCFLKNPQVAEMISKTLMHFNGIRYLNFCWCVMPNHVHVICKPFIKLFEVVHSWKSYSANQANKILKRNGEFWHKDSYNHIIRSKKELGFQINYVWFNPEKAGYKDWKYRYLMRE